MFNGLGCHTTVTLRGVRSTCSVTVIFQLSVSFTQPLHQLSVSFTQPLHDFGYTDTTK